MLRGDDTSIILSHKTRESASMLLVEQFNPPNTLFSANGPEKIPEKIQLLHFHLNRCLSSQNSTAYLPTQFNTIR